MRAWLFALLLILPVSYALLVESTGKVGQNPVLYGDNVAYERDGSVYVYDFSRSEEREIAKGKNPSLFGFTVVFETGTDNGTMIRFANVQDKTITDTNSVGRNPYVFSDFIVFSTKESELGIDFSNDGDLDDDIIRQYDIDKKEVSNLKAVGDFPVINQRALLFLTEEKQIDVDLNADGDKDDVILRVFDKETRLVGNTKLSATRPVLSKSNKAVFVSDGKLVLFDAVEQNAVKTDIAGNSPTIFGDVVVFEHDGSLYGFKENVARMNVLGMHPSLFEDTLVFVSSEKDLGDLNDNGRADEFVIRLAEEEDSDADDVSDFVDNCPAVVNVDQLDSNKDGVGDACEIKKVEKTEAKEPVEQPVSEPADSSKDMQVAVEEKGVAWYWYLLIILLLPFICYYGYKYYKKRQKSFGF